ncbi:MAG: hypothetical protein IJ560_03345 [Alphaproteobacteria bacterium]|nr:hypothetical protein [Alphaproteobacteria bacterium]
MKLRNIRRFRRFLIATAAILLLCVIAALIVPPMFTLNNMRNKIEIAFADQTGVSATINGDVHFSLAGGATIVARDVVIPNGHIDKLVFGVPMRAMFDIRNATLNRNIAVHGMRMEIERLIPTTLNYNIDLRDSVIRFLDKDYEIVSGQIRDGNFNGIVRTDQHRYDVEYNGDEFTIINHTNNLTMTGVLMNDGAARGHMQIETPNVNSWFQFRTPRIIGNMRITADFEWDGNWGVKFKNITANNFTGNIELMPNGDKNIQLRAHNIDYDFSFLLNPNRMFYRTTFDLDFYGNLRLGDFEFGHLKMNAIGTQVQIQIANIIADDVAVTGGVIDAGGAHNIMITAPFDGQTVMCLFSGTPEIWRCDEFTYGNIHGTVNVNNDVFSIKLQSDENMPAYDTFLSEIHRIARRGTVEFDFADIAGVFSVDGTNVRATYRYARNKPLNWGNADIKFIPEFMRNATGDFSWTGDMMEFTPTSGRWKISMYDNYFYLYGDNIKDLIPNIDTSTMNDLAYVVSGKYDNGTISELTVKIAGHEFHGTANGTNITLETDILDVDAFVSQDFIDNYSEREFLTNAPLIQVFNLPVNISLTAGTMIYNGDEYRNFVYSLKPNVQTFSISDDDRGNVLATITRDKNNYNIFAQLNRFATHGKILTDQMPINVRDSRVTAELNIQTSGQIAHDIFYNMTGEIDAAFDGGVLIGIGTDEFYSQAGEITKLNAEYALGNMLAGGESEIKQMHISGTYTNGNFQSVNPIEIRMRHVDAHGNISINDGKMDAAFQMTMRGTSPEPKTIDFTISPDGHRDYSLTQIMGDFDASFLREFVRTHDRF